MTPKIIEIQLPPPRKTANGISIAKSITKNMIARGLPHLFPLKSAPPIATQKKAEKKPYKLSAWSNVESSERPSKKVEGPKKPVVTNTM